MLMLTSDMGHYCLTVHFQFIVRLAPHNTEGVAYTHRTHLLQVFQLHLSLIAQLEALKGMADWAVYVALHLPRHSSPAWPHLRDNLVQELLMRHAPEWVSDAANKRKFLLEELQLPAAWLDQSLAQWAHYCQDDSGGHPCAHQLQLARDHCC